ncbi:MAG: Rieske 2Fe-2S domain-containing protein [Chloroflexi bacterium]|nr:Rieske 2Fe-2S domain-containing protein [Chloroflexota bacterium]
MTIDVLRDVTHVMESLSPEQNQLLDRWSDELQRIIGVAIEQGGPAARRMKNWLNGVWLGHPLHPALTDLALGAWSTGTLMDAVGARGTADAALTVGVLSAVPTALAGAADWSDTSGEARRTGLVHALLNSAGLVFMIGSLFARRTERRALGVGLSTVGLFLSGLSAWLGGHLVFGLGANVNRAAFEPTVDDFQVVAAADAIQPGKLFGAKANVDGTTIPLVLLKKGRTIMAISATCTHWGGSLAEGKLVTDDGDCVECPLHGSQFNLADGSVQQGPATVPAHVFETRINAGNVEVRRRA